MTFRPFTSSVILSGVLMPFTVVAFITIVPFTVYANNKPAEVMVVTATRSEQPLIKSLSSVTVLSREDIERSQAPDLVTLLSRLPGVDVDQHGGRGANAAVRIRGTEGDHSLFLINGIRSSSATSGTTAISHLPIEQIERIEIVRGPKSSLYGAEALGGVIQIFTKKSSHELQPVISAEYGSDNFRKSTAGIQGGLGDTQLGVNLSHEETDGYDRTRRSDNDIDSDEDGYRQTSLSAHLLHQFAHDASLALNYLRSEGNTEFDPGNSHSDFVNETRSASLQLPLSSLFTMKFELGQFQDRTKNFGSFPSEYETRRNSALAQVDYAPDHAHLLSVGFDYAHDKVDSTTQYSDDDSDNRAFFLQYQGNLHSLSTTASLRQDDHEAFGKHETGSLALGYDLNENTLLSISYGTAFRAPNFNDLYFPFTDFGDYGSFQGNPDLKPEQSKTVEVMVRGQATSLQWSLSIYKSDIKNLITRITTAPENINKAEITGAEATTSFEFADWETDIAISYVDPRDASTDDRLIRRSRGKISAELSRQFGKFNGVIAWQAQSNRFDNGQKRLGGFNTVDIRGSYQLTPALLLAAKVENIFDNHYTLLNNYATCGMTASVSARYNF